MVGDCLGQGVEGDGVGGVRDPDGRRVGGEVGAIERWGY